MAGLAKSQLAWITARSGVARSGASRSGCAPKSYELKPVTSASAGQILWDRAPASDGDPAATAQTAVTIRE